MYENLAVIAVFLLCFSLVAGQLEKTVISGPMVYVGFGFLAGPLALAGSGESPSAKLFLGWFGPRGLASIVFAVIVFGYDLPHGDLLAKTAVYTVLISVVVHGLTANPVARWIGQKARG